MHYEKEHIKNLRLQTAPLTELGFNTAAALLSRSHEGDHLPEASSLLFLSPTQLGLSSHLELDYSSYRKLLNEEGNRKHVGKRRFEGQPDSKQKQEH